MAAGGYGRGSGVPLNQRRRMGEPRVDPAGARVTDHPPPVPAAQPDPALDQSRHCWVAAPVDTTRPRPGLLLEWRRVERGRFEGRVVYQAELRPGRFALVEEWVPAELLTPLDSP